MKNKNKIKIWKTNIMMRVVMNNKANKNNNIMIHSIIVTPIKTCKI